MSLFLRLYISIISLLGTAATFAHTNLFRYNGLHGYLDRVGTVSVTLACLGESSIAAMFYSENL